MIIDFANGKTLADLRFQEINQAQVDRRASCLK